MAVPVEGEKKIQIYSTSATSDREVTPYWKDKYEKDARKYWDIFYKRHRDKFFKDRHYLDKEWGQYFHMEEGENLVFLEPNGRVLLRDYSAGDLAQERLNSKDQKISDNFYVRGDGTRAYYFSNDFLTNLFARNGFYAEKVDICCKQVENRSLELVMNRRWIQAVFSLGVSNVPMSTNHVDLLEEEMNKEKVKNANPSKDLVNNNEIDVSDSILEMFDMSMTPSIDEVIEIKLRGFSFRIKCLGREYQHTCKSTGLMLWESARFMSMLLAENPSIVLEKTLLELGCGSAGICSMVAAHSAKFVVSTDGDTEALDLLRQNVASNLESALVDKMAIKRLLWGNKEHVNAVKDLLNHKGGFDLIIGTDVTYNPDAVVPLFETARQLISDGLNMQTKPALILCHMQRRVDEDTIISAATLFGFKLVDRFVHKRSKEGGIISSWFSESLSQHSILQTTPLNIMYFEV